jgi:hypothetical protein
MYRRSLVGAKLAGDAQVVELSVAMAQSEDELRSPQVSRQTDDDAVGGAMTLEVR